MSSKFSMVRRDLEAARNRLSDTDELDIAVSLVLDHIIETVLKIEYRKPTGNVVPFPSQRRLNRGHSLSGRIEQTGPLRSGDDVV